MKIFIIGDIKEKGKFEAPVLVADGLFKSLVKKEVDVSYLTYFKEGAKYSRRQKLFGRIIISAKPAIIRLGIIPLISYILRQKPDVVHIINLEFFYVVLYPFFLITGTRVVYTVHGYIHYEYKRFRDLPKLKMVKSKIAERVNLMFADRVAFLSERTARLASSHMRNKKRGVVLDNGIMLQSGKKIYSMNGEKHRINLAFVIYQGSGERKEKGLDLLLKYLEEDGGEYRINFYGNLFPVDNLYGNVEVIYHGYLEDEKLTGEILKNDSFIAPSRLDTFNMSLLKAMNLGMLFLASDRVGLTERFDAELKRFVYRFNSKKDFVEKLHYVINLSTEERNSWGAYIKEFSLRFDWDKVVDQYTGLYNELR